MTSAELVAVGRSAPAKSSPRNYKVSNGKQNVTAGKAIADLNSCQSAVPWRIARYSCRRVHLPNTANGRKPHPL